MTVVLVKRLLLRVFLPGCLLIAALLRPSFISLLYAVLALLGPMFPSVGARGTGQMPVVTRLYIFGCFTVALAFSIAQLAYQIGESFFNSGHDSSVLKCDNSTLGKWMRQAGFIRVVWEASAYNLLYITSELLALVGSTITLLVCMSHHNVQSNAAANANANPPGSPQVAESMSLGAEQQPPPAPSLPPGQLILATGGGNMAGDTTGNNTTKQLVATGPAVVATLKRLSDVGVVLGIWAALGAIAPSILNATYFLVAMALLSWWASYRPLLHRHHHNSVKCAMLIYAAFHFLLLYAYQIPVVQEEWWPPADSLSARLLGLSSLVRMKCTVDGGGVGEGWWVWTWSPNNGHQWNGYANVVALLVAYHLVIVQYCWTRAGISGGLWKAAMGGEDVDDGGSSVHEELLSSSQSVSGGSHEETDGTVASRHHHNQLRKITSEHLDREKIARLLGIGAVGAQRDDSTTQAGHVHLLTAREGLQEFIYFLLYHCYVFALLAMMTWALLYHSVFGLLFLLLACVLWALRDSRRWLFRFSPLLLVYAEFLLLVQYASSLNVHREIAAMRGDKEWKWLVESAETIGGTFATTSVQAILTLIIKLLLSLPLFVLLRLYRRERYFDSLTEHDRAKRLRTSNYGTFPAPPTSLVNRNRRQQGVAGTSGNNNNSAGVGQSGGDETDTLHYNQISHFFTKWWIFVVAGFLLLNATTWPFYDYSLGFFVFLSLLVISLQISFGFFVGAVYPFLTLLIVYASLVLVAVYTYQFPNVPGELEHLTHGWLDAERARRIGLSFKNGTPLLPIALIVVTMLQLKFFQEPWKRMVKPATTNGQVPSTGRTETQVTSAPIRPSAIRPGIAETSMHEVAIEMEGTPQQGLSGANAPSTSTTFGQEERLPEGGALTPEQVERTMLREGHQLMHATMEFLWRVAEVHGWRFILLVLVFVAMGHYCALNLVVVLFVDAALCFPGVARPISIAMLVYMAAVFIARRVFQLHYPNTSALSGGSDSLFSPDANNMLSSDFAETDPILGAGTSSKTPELNDLIAKAALERLPSLAAHFLNDSAHHHSSCLNLNQSDEFNTTYAWIGLNDSVTASIAPTSMQSDLQGLVLVVVLIALHACVRYRQRQKRVVEGREEPPEGVLFPDVPPEQFDRSLRNCWKSLCNYGFYKFGLEICMAGMAIAAWWRMDFLGALLLIWLAVFITMPRSSVRRLWPAFTIYLAVLFPLQYAMTIGLAPEWCLRYPWTNALPSSVLDEWLDRNLAFFFDLADYRQESSRYAYFTLVDFLLLAVVTAQEWVFRKESPAHPAGSNESIYAPEPGDKRRNRIYRLYKQNPRRDYVVEQRSFVDFAKVALFTYGHWITIVWVLVAGLGGTSLFALGYLLLAFWMLWQGNNLYTMNNYGKTLRWWRKVALYTVVTMLCKVMLQLFACVVLVDYFNMGDDIFTKLSGGTIISGRCAVRLLFGVLCVNTVPNANIERHLTTAGVPRDTTCVSSSAQLLSVPVVGGSDLLHQQENKMLYDMLALFFILFQLRILNSWFFQHCMIEFRCEMIQAKRGAILINQLIEKEMREQNEQQDRKFREIKQRTATIRQRYEEQQRQSASALAFTPQTYAQAKRRSTLSSESITHDWPYICTCHSPQQYHHVHFGCRQRPNSFFGELFDDDDEDDPLPSYDPRYAIDHHHHHHHHQPSSAAEAKRAGDYYMFDYNPDVDELIRPTATFVPEVTPGAGDFNKLDPVQLVHALGTHNLDFTKTLDNVEAAEKYKDNELRMIVVVSKNAKTREMAARELARREHIAAARAQLPQESTTEADGGGGHEDGEEQDDGGVLVKMRRRHVQTESDEETEAQSGQPPQPDLDEVATALAESTSWSQMVISVLLFIWKMFLSMLDYLAAFLNRRSREHRYVAYVLAKEKERLKMVMRNELYDARKTPTQLRQAWEQHNMHLVTSEQDISRLEDEAHNRWQERDVFARLTTAVGNCAIAHTDVLCFFLAALAHARCAGLITLPLPAMVFFWGSLAAPRPSKAFWISMIAYTEAVIVVKFCFQFGFWVWNTSTSVAAGTGDAYRAEYVLGVQAVPYYAVADVALLIMLFFHRYMLRRLGLWKDANVQDTGFSHTSVRSNSNSPQEKGGLAGENSVQDNSEAAKRNGDETTRDTPASTVSTHIEDVPSGHASFDEGGGERKVSPSSPPGGGPSSSSLSERAHEQLKPTTSTHQAAEPGEAGGAVEEAPPTEPTAPAGFFERLVRPKFRYIRDLYPLMFFLDVACFFIVAFGYSSFGEGGSGDVLSDIKTSRIPLTFALMLVVISLMIVIDRGLYLRKAVVSKLIYQLLSVVFLHVWIFFVLPSITSKRAIDNSKALVLYGVKCIYFIVSAWQIRNGYPSLCIGNLLTHSYGLVNMVLFRIFYIVPFLFELRTAIDWTWTDTSMPLFDFFNMENFYATIYNLKCARTFEQSFPAPRGEAKSTVVKYLMGLPMILILILTIWLPFIVYALVNQIGERVVPQTAKLTFSVEGYPPLYTVQAQGVDLTPLTKSDYAALINLFSANSTYDKKKQSVAFLKDYEEKSILRARFRPESEVNWLISADSLDALKVQLARIRDKNSSRSSAPPNKYERPMRLNVHLEFTRERSAASQEPQRHTGDWSIEVVPDLAKALYNVLNGSKEVGIKVHQVLPMYVVVPSEGQVRAASSLLTAGVSNNEEAVDDEGGANATGVQSFFNTLKLHLEGVRGGNSSGGKGGKRGNTSAADYMHWTAQMQVNDRVPALPLTNVTYGERNRTYVEAMAFVDRVLPSFIGKYFTGGIIAAYIGLILLLGKLIRTLIATTPTDVIVSEMPNPDYLLKICLDIYLVREARDFVLEQDLFAKLIFLFRSPSTLIKWTRYRVKED